MNGVENKNRKKANHKSLLKKGSAVFLAALMALGSNMTTYAESYGKLSRAKDISASVAAAVAGPQSIISEAGGKGQVNVSIGTALGLASQVDFTVCLTDPQNKQLAGIITMGGDSEVENGLSFEGLSEGVYRLSVSAKGFATYTQNISVKDRAYTINLTTGFLGGMNYEEGAAHPGVLLIGDVNGDGINDAADRTELVNAIDKEPSLAAADLNGDGIANLVDLQYMAAGYSDNRDTLAKIENSIPAAAIELSVGDNTSIEVEEGQDAQEVLNALLRGQGSVILKPSEGEDISQNPVSLEFDLQQMDETAVADGIIIETGGDNPIDTAVFTITYMDVDENGQPIEKTEDIPVGSDDVHFLLLSEQVRAEKDSAGNILLHLGSQVAIKKVTFTIIGMKNNNNLVEISKVEFVNGMEDRIPEPEMDIPENLTAVAGSAKISLKWNPCVNITGYEVLIRQGNKQETIKTTHNELTVTSFGGKEMVNYLEYQIQVQSVNGTWRSGYCEAVTATPKPTGRPDKPDNVSAKGQYQSIVVSWKKMKDTLTYNLYYKESSQEEYQKVEGIEGNSYTINNLADLTEYTMYVTGVNEFGESSPSLSVSAKTTDLNPPVMPKYNLINTGEEGEKGAHIVSVKMNGTMIDSPLDTEKGTAWGTVDHDPKSYYYKNTWDDGGYNPINLSHGLTYEFDQAYKIDTIAFTTMQGVNSSIFYQRVRYWDENGNAAFCSVSRQSKKDAEGRSYFVFKLAEPVNAKKLQIALACYDTKGRISVSEVYFYYYDTLMDEIMALYEDDLHTVLRSDVTQQTIDALRVKINTVDEVSGEYHPDRQLLERELQTAETILNDGKLNDSVVIHGGITTKDVGRGFGGLNAWQPLGIVAEAQEEIMVYVGHSTMKTGSNTNLQLVATQYHAETGPMAKTVATLKVGANKITIPKIWSITGYESGGALYVQYTGDSAADQYAVRVSGGVQVPKLDLYQVTDSAERLARAKTYVEELQQYVSGIEAKHEEAHQYSGNQLAYDKQNCILGAVDILLDTMMLSLPAQQILAGAGSGSTEQKAQKIVDSMDAMEDMMYLFYQHKGLNSAAADAVNQIPKGHLNIRYQRMFSGAFMYASGNHIGIEWGSTTGLIAAKPVQADAEGRYQSGKYFGWGIAHEIGHCINQGTYAVAEVTNNYYSVLAQAKDTNGSVRFQYANVFKKVASGAKGSASNVFTQLGMYWQLHLAYDKGYNYKTYENYQEQLANLFFARVDTYARSTAKAPAPGGVALTLTGDKNQDLMRLSCAAAEKNILTFFERWGMTPNEGTRAYAGQFDEETRAIYYANDDARVYSLQGGTSVLNSEGTTEAVGDMVTATQKDGSANQVDIILGSKNIPEADVLGYEIVRCMYSGSEVIRETAGFAVKGTNTFTDTVHVNNRMIWYEVRVIDQYLNQSAVKVLDPIKIEHDGSLEKDYWTVTTENLTSPDDVGTSTNQDSMCSGSVTEDSANDDPTEAIGADRLIDNNVNTVYTATANGNAAVILEFNKTLTVTGFKYRGAGAMTGEYMVSVRSDGEWKQVAQGSWKESDIQYFSNEDGGYVGTFAADAVKVTFNGLDSGQVSIGEMDVLGVTGDNVDFRRVDDGTVVIGKLSADYRFGDKEDNVIPKDSILFTGAYKGSPAYNTVILFDQNGNIVGGIDEEGSLKAQQIILAEVPDQGLIQNVSDGTWIYWIEPEQQVDLSELKQVRAELYRVNNALTQEGQRLVSDSLWETVPSTLPGIQLSSNADQNNGAGQGSVTDQNSNAGQGNGADQNSNTDQSSSTGQGDGANQSSNAGQGNGADQNSNAGQGNVTDQNSNTGQSNGADQNSNTGESNGADQSGNAGQNSDADQNSNAGESNGADQSGNAGQNSNADQNSNAGQDSSTDQGNVPDQNSNAGGSNDDQNGSTGQ